MAEYGADVHELRTLAKQFTDIASTLEETIRSLSVRISNSNAWRGPDADRFRSQWNTTDTARLRSTSQAITVAADTLRRNASEQESTSAAATGSEHVGKGTDSALDPGSRTGSSTRSFLDALHHSGGGSRDGIRIQRIIGEDEKPRFVVYLDGTGSGEKSMSSVDDNIAVFGFGTDTQKKITELMRESGIDKNSDLMIVGYSQGGIHAQNIAASGEFGNPLVITKGTPPSTGVSPLTDILRLEKRNDEILLFANPLAASQDLGSGFLDLIGRGENDVTMRSGSIIPRLNEGPTHTDREVYGQMADEFDRSSSAEYARIQERLRPFTNGRVVNDSDA